MMRNTLSDLNNYLFEALERLTDDELTEEDLEKEMRRTEAITDVADTAIRNAELALKTMKYLNDNGVDRAPVPPMLEAKKE